MATSKVRRTAYLNVEHLQPSSSIHLPSTSSGAQCKLGAPNNVNKPGIVRPVYAEAQTALKVCRRPVEVIIIRES